MARASGRTIQITGRAFPIRIGRLRTASVTGCHLDARQVVRESVRYLEILGMGVRELLGNRIVRAMGDPERRLVSQIAQEMDSREFFRFRIDRETDDPERLANQTGPVGREGNLGSLPTDLATHVLHRDRLTGLRSTGSKQVQATVRRSNATAAMQVLAIACNHAQRRLRNVLRSRHALRSRHGQRLKRDRLLTRGSRRNAEHLEERR